MDQELLKREFEKKKALLEKDSLILKENKVEIKILLNSNIETLKINGELVHQNVLDAINNSIQKSKQEFEKKWIEYLQSYGLKL